MNRKEIIPTLIKLCFVVVFICFAAFLVLSDHANDISIEKLGTYMTTHADLTDMEACSKSELMHYYQLQESDTDGYFYYKNPSTMSVDEILIIKCTSRDQAAEILTAMQSHLDSQKEIFDGYGTNQISLLNSAFLETKGNYAFYMCGENAQNWRDLLLSQL